MLGAVIQSGNMLVPATKSLFFLCQILLIKWLLSHSFGRYYYSTGTKDKSLSVNMNKYMCFFLTVCPHVQSRYSNYTGIDTLTLCFYPNAFSFCHDILFVMQHRSSSAKCRLTFSAPCCFFINAVC